MRLVETLAPWQGVLLTEIDLPPILVQSLLACQPVFFLKHFWGENMERRLIDDNLVSELGNKCETILEVPGTQPPEARIEDPRVLAMELSCKPVQVEGYRLVEEEIFPGGQRLVRQEYYLAPDIAFSLFKFFEEVDKQTFPDENTMN